MTILIQDLIEADVYPDADTAIQEALRVLWQERPAVRLNVAVHRYSTEELSIAKAAALAGVSFDRMKELLVARAIPLRLGPETIDEARAEVEALQKMRT
jgi:predicted HTH domain antitoxin